MGAGAQMRARCLRVGDSNRFAARTKANLAEIFMGDAKVDRLNVAVKTV